jgi:hypothetical protein
MQKIFTAFVTALLFGDTHPLPDLRSIDLKIIVLALHKSLGELGEILDRSSLRQQFISRLATIEFYLEAFRQTTGIDRDEVLQQAQKQIRGLFKAAVDRTETIAVSHQGHQDGAPSRGQGPTTGTGHLREVKSDADQQAAAYPHGRYTPSKPTEDPTFAPPRGSVAPPAAQDSPFNRLSEGTPPVEKGYRYLYGWEVWQEGDDLNVSDDSSSSGLGRTWVPIGHGSVGRQIGDQLVGYARRPIGILPTVQEAVAKAARAAGLNTGRH